MKNNINKLLADAKTSLDQGQDYETKALSFIKKSVISYKEAGEHLVLIQQECKKQKIPFYPLIKEKLSLKERTAQRYMQLAKNPKTKTLTEESLSKVSSISLTTMLSALNLDDEEFEKFLDGDETVIDTTKQKNAESNSVNESEEVLDDSEEDVQSTSSNTSNNEESISEKDVSEEAIKNPYPHLFSDEEYINVYSATKAQLIEMLIYEREIVKDLESKQYSNNFNQKKVA